MKAVFHSPVFHFLSAFLLAASACATFALPENKSAWNLFLDNRPLEAREAFKKNLGDKNPAVAGEAARGMGVLARFLGNNVEEVRWSVDAFNKDKDTLALMAGQIRHLHLGDMWGAHDVKQAYDMDNAFAKQPTVMTAPAVFELGRRYVNDGDISKAEKIFSGMGLVRQWWMIGPFSNISGSGFDKAYPPETGTDLTQAYDGKNGDQVRWFPLQQSAPATWIWSENHIPSANAILYFSTQIESPRERKIYLSFGASGSFKVFLNDRLVLAERVFRNTGVDAFLQEVTLHKGANRILVKLGNEDRYSNFLMRFMELDGRGASDLKVVKPEGAYPKDTEAVTNLKSTPMLDREMAYLQDRLQKDPDDEDAALLRMDLFNVHEMTDSGEVWALSRLDRHPQSSLWQSLLAEALMRSRQTTRSQEYFKAAFHNSPYCALGWHQELTRLMNSASPEAVLEFISKSPEEMRNHKQALISSMAKLAEQGRRDEALKIFPKMEDTPDFDEESAIFLAIVYQNQGRKKDAQKAWRKYLKYGQSSASAYQSLAELDLKAGDFSDAVEVLEEGTRYLPENPNLYYSLANIHMHQKKFQEAEKYLASGLALAPYNPVLLGLKGTLKSLEGDKEAAKKSLHQSVESNYNDFPSWDKLMEMEGRPSFESLAPLPNVDSLIKSAANWDGLKRERGSILSYIEDVFFYPSRATRHRGFLVVHLPSQNAVSSWKQYSIPYNPTYETLGITRAVSRKAAGGEVDAEIEGRTIVFKSLEPGDYIVIEWTIKDAYDGEMARQAWGFYDFKLGVPVFDSRLRLYMAGTDTIGYTVRGRNVDFASAEKSGVKMRLFSRGPYTIPINERFVPVNDSTSPDVIYSTFNNWGQISDWYANLVENKTAASPILRRVADSLFAGLSGPNADAIKAARVHDYVTTNVAYSSLPFRQSGWIPQTSQEVLASRLGDCKDMAALAKSLLDLAGLESHLVLVATRDEFGTRSGPIGPHFNHCILAFMLGGKEHYMDLTDPHLHWSRLPKGDQGAVALVVKRGNRTLIHLPVDKPDDRKITRRLNCSLNDSGVAAMSSKTTRTGILARGQRDTYRELGPEERRQEMLKALSDDYADVALDSLWFGNLAPSIDSVDYTYAFRARQAVKVSGATRIFGLYFPDKLSNEDVPDDQPRPNGVDLYGAWYSLGTYNLSGTITFPAGWKLLNRPAPVRLKSPYGEYSLTFDLKGNTLSYKRKAVFDMAEVVPAKDAGKVRSFLTQVVKNDDVQLVFTEKGK